MFQNSVTEVHFSSIFFTKTSPSNQEIKFAWSDYELKSSFHPQDGDTEQQNTSFLHSKDRNNRTKEYERNNIIINY